MDGCEKWNHTTLANEACNGATWHACRRPWKVDEAPLVEPGWPSRPMIGPLGGYPSAENRRSRWIWSDNRRWCVGWPEQRAQEAGGERSPPRKKRRRKEARARRSLTSSRGWGRRSDGERCVLAGLGSRQVLQGENVSPLSKRMFRGNPSR